MWVGRDSQGGGSRVECCSSERWGGGCATDSARRQNVLKALVPFFFFKCRSVGEPVGGKVGEAEHMFSWFLVQCVQQYLDKSLDSRFKVLKLNFWLRKKKKIMAEPEAFH